MYEIYSKLRDSKGLTDYQVAKETGLGRSTFTDLKNGHKPSIQTLSKIAEYFGVSHEYLMTGKDTEKASDSGKKYYFSDETAETAQAIFKDRDLHALFDAARDATPRDLQMAAEMLRRFKATNPDG